MAQISPDRIERTLTQSTASSIDPSRIEVDPIQRPTQLEEQPKQFDFGRFTSEVLRRQPFGVSQVAQSPTFQQAVRNIPSSGMDFLKNIYQAVRHPVQTAKAVGKVVSGGVSASLPGTPSISEEEDIAIFNNFLEFMKDRYGGKKELEKTFKEDPVGLAADASLVLTGGGSAIGAAGQLTRIPQVAQAGRAVTQVGRAVDPFALAGGAIRGTAEIAKTTNSLAKTALGMTKTTGLSRIDELADYFVAKGLNVNRKSLRILDEDMARIRKKVDDIVDEKTAEGIKIKTTDIASEFDKLFTDAARQGFEPTDLRILKRMQEDFIGLHGATLTPRQVQDLKVGFNKGFKSNLESRFGQARQKARDTLRKGAKAELERLHPQLRELNKQEGLMIELNKAIEDAIISFEKRPTFGVRGLIAGGLAGAAGGAMADLPTAVKFATTAFVAEKLMTNPKIQVIAARAAHKQRMRLAKAGQLTSSTAPLTTGVGFQAGRIQQLQQDQEQQPLSPVFGLENQLSTHLSNSISSDRDQDGRLSFSSSDFQTAVLGDRSLRNLTNRTQRKEILDTVSRLKKIDPPSENTINLLGKIGIDASDPSFEFKLMSSALSIPGGTRLINSILKENKGVMTSRGLTMLANFIIKNKSNMVRE